jgi:hypothetical protein
MVLGRAYEKLLVLEKGYEVRISRIVTTCSAAS